MSASCLKRTLGDDADDMFAYETARIVRIKDVRLGCMYLTFVFLILLYVIVFQLAFANEHFKRKDVHGTARITIQQPTKFCNPNEAGCESNYNSLRDLPYCNLYDGNSTVVSEDHKQKCTFADQHTLAPTGMLGERLFVPTRIDRNEEPRGCEPSEKNEYTCTNEYEIDPNPAIVYVADIERYTVLVAHSYHRDALKGSNTLLQGHYFECIESEADKEGTSTAWSDALFGEQECKGKLERRPIKCINSKCKELKGLQEKSSSFLQAQSDSDQQEDTWAGPDALLDLGSAARRPRAGRKAQRAPPATAGSEVPPHSAASIVALETAKTAGRPDVSKFNAPDVFAIPDGDIFKISKLLELAGGLDLDKSFNHYGEPLREAGTVLELEVIYKNLKPFQSWIGGSEVRYDYKVKQRPMEEMKTELFAQAQHLYPEKRVMENRHGVYIIVKISGEFGFFSIVFTIIMLTTAAGLVGAAVFITDKVSIYCSAHKKDYYKFKYAEHYTPDQIEEESDPIKQQAMKSGQAEL